MLFHTSTLAAVLSSALLARASPTNSTAATSESLAQVITKCTVPKTAALTFDDGPYEYIQVRVFQSFLFKLSDIFGLLIYRISQRR
jgi:hypothetical protein